MVSDCEDGDVRLTGGPSPQEGTIEVCLNNVWGGICSIYYIQYYDAMSANVVCSQLGYQPVGNNAQ